MFCVVASPLFRQHRTSARLNERLSQCIAARESDRLSNLQARVAAGLARLLDTLLLPGANNVLRITQHEIDNLVGLSRQRVNQALHALELRQWVRTEYGGLSVSDVPALRKAAFVTAGQHE